MLHGTSSVEAQDMESERSDLEPLMSLSSISLDSCIEPGGH